MVIPQLVEREVLYLRFPYFPKLIVLSYIIMLVKRVRGKNHLYSRMRILHCMPSMRRDIKSYVRVL